MEKTECGSVWEYYLFETFIRHKCRLPAGHGGRHEGFAAEWSREHVRLVPSEHPGANTDTDSDVDIESDTDIEEESNVPHHD